MDTLDILDGLRASSGIPWAYRFFEITPPFPFGVLLDDNIKPFFADDKPYFSALAARLELYDAIPNADAESAVESWLDANAVTWSKASRENVAPDDDTAPFFMTSYHFEVI